MRHLIHIYLKNKIVHKKIFVPVINIFRSFFNGMQIATETKIGIIFDTKINSILFFNLFYQKIIDGEFSIANNNYYLFR